MHPHPRQRTPEGPHDLRSTVCPQSVPPTLRVPALPLPGGPKVVTAAAGAAPIAVAFRSPAPAEVFRRCPRCAGDLQQPQGPDHP